MAGHYLIRPDIALLPALFALDQIQLAVAILAAAIARVPYLRVNDVETGCRAVLALLRQRLDAIPAINLCIS
jgi:hypothetical protein